MARPDQFLRSERHYFGTVDYYLVENRGDEPPRGLAVYVIYGRNTPERPGKFVLRRHVVREDGRNRGDAARVDVDRDPMAVGDTLEEVRRALPADRVPLRRDREDDPTIVETWI